MPEKAHVTSVEAIEEFRTSLLLYISKARPTVEEVSGDVLRMRLWLQSDQRLALEALVRRRSKELEQAQAELSSARIAVFRQETSAQQLAVQRARRALEDAEGKLKRLKHWNREFDSRVEPLVKQLEKLHTVLANDLGKATALLSHIVTTLSAYANTTPPPGVAPAETAPPTE